MQAAADDLNAALAAMAHGGMAATAEKNNKQEVLIALLRKLKHYVEDNCKNDLAVLLSSGFQAASSNRNRSPLANPAILSVDFGNSAELVLKVTPIARAKCYEVRSAAAGVNGVPGPGKQPDCSPTRESMTISGLVPGTDLCFPGARRRRIHRL